MMLKVDFKRPCDANSWMADALPKDLMWLITRAFPRQKVSLVRTLCFKPDSTAMVCEETQ